MNPLLGLPLCFPINHRMGHVDAGTLCESMALLVSLSFDQVYEVGVLIIWNNFLEGPPTVEWIRDV